MIKKLSMVALGIIAVTFTMVVVTQHEAEAVNITVKGRHSHSNEDGIAGCVRIVKWDNFRYDSFRTDTKGNYMTPYGLRNVSGRARYVIGAGSNRCGAASGGMVWVPDRDITVRINY